MKLGVEMRCQKELAILKVKKGVNPLRLDGANTYGA